MEAFFLKYWQIISWGAGGLCTVHGSVLVWVLKLIGKKIDRPEFENRVALIEHQVSSINSQLIIIARQNGEMLAGISAIKESSKDGDQQIKELLGRLERTRPDHGRRGE